MSYVPNSGSTVAFQGTVPWSVLGTVSGSVAAVQSGTAITSISGVVNTAGSVVAFQGTNPWIITGSVQANITPTGNQSVSGTVGASVVGAVPVNIQGSVATVIIGGSIAANFTPPANQSVSGTVGASLIGLSPVSVSNFPVTQNVSGSVVTTQGTNPWIITGSVQASIVPTANQSVSGTVTVGSLLAMPGIVSTANSTTATLGIGAAFTGTSEEVKDFGSIVIAVFADQVSATDGLSIQQSSNGTNWDIVDTYTISANTGKTIQVQPAARFFRIVYTNGGTGQGAFRLQTIYHPQYVKPTSQRAQDGYTNETDLEQNQNFGMVFNGTNWDRARGNSSIGTLVNMGAGSILSIQSGTRITSVSGTVIITGSVQGSFTPSGNQSVSGTVNIGTGGPVSVLGTMSVLGTVPVTQATTPWIITGSVQSATNQNVSGSIISFQGGTQITSISGVAYAEDSAHTDGNPGLFTFGVRNDTVASFVSANTDYTPIGLDSAGRTLTKPFSPDQASVIGHNSIVAIGTGVGSVIVMQAPGAGLKNYLTDFNIANTGAVTTIVQFNDSDASIVGRTIAPAGGGSNHSFAVPLTSWSVNKAITVQLITASSVFVTVSGYKAP